MNNMLLIQENSSVREALEQLNNLAMNGPVLFVQNGEGKVLGSVSDGDIRRGLLEGKTIDSKVIDVAKKEFKFIVHNSQDRNEKFNQMKDSGINIFPVLDDEQKFIDIVELSKKKAFIPAEGIIMAGGLGSRLRPLTDNTPKPLLKVGEKPIIQYNFERLSEFGVDNIHVTLRYLGEQLVDYFGNGESFGCNIDYVTEVEPLGTIGAVKLIKNINQEYVILMNSDLQFLKT